MPFSGPTAGPYVQGTALPWWAVVLWTVIGSVLFLLMAVAWCIMFGDQCYCAPKCSDDEAVADDLDDLVPRPPKRRFWMPKRGRYKSAIVADEENTSMDELMMMEPMTPAKHGGTPGRPHHHHHHPNPHHHNPGGGGECHRQLQGPYTPSRARPDYHIDSE